MEAEKDSTVKSRKQGRLSYQGRQLPCGWYAVMLDSKLKRKPSRVQLLGQNYVVYRDEAGRAVAHIDSCPHRNAPLSMGCIVEETLQCPYHGWRFDAQGTCVSVPGLVGEPKSSHRLLTLPTRISQGLVFIHPEPGPASHEPFVIPQHEDAQYSTILREVVFPGDLVSVVENALDVPHTSVLHRGLFRSGKKQKVTVRTRRYQTWVEAEYLGEKPPQGMLGRLLNAGNSADLVVEHWDRFILPGVLQVEYRLGKRAHLVVTGYCCPIDDEATKVFAQACIRTPLNSVFEKILLLLAEPLAMRVVGQDIEILREQMQNLKSRGDRQYLSTEIDVIFPHLVRLLKEGISEGLPVVGAKNEPLREESEVTLMA